MTGMTLLDTKRFIAQAAALHGSRAPFILGIMAGECEKPIGVIAPEEPLDEWAFYHGFLDGSAIFFGRKNEERAN